VENKKYVVVILERLLLEAKRVSNIISSDPSLSEIKDSNLTYKVVTSDSEIGNINTSKREIVSDK